MTAPDPLLGVDENSPEDGEDSEVENLSQEAPQEASQTVSGVEGLDRRAAAAAYRKAMEGKPLTSREEAIVRRYEKEKEERLRWQYYRSIPQRHWTQMSGRQAKVLIEQQQRYGLPLGGKTIDLTKLARAFHDFLADNAHKLARDDDELMQGSASPALERYREERAAIARLDRLEREGKLVPRDQMREALGRIAAIVRSAGDSLQRQFGQAAADILLEALDDAQREMTRSFPEAAIDQSLHLAAAPLAD